MTDMAMNLPLMRELNHGSLKDPRVKVINADAMVWLQEASKTERFDLAIVDFPDPNTYSVGKLYTTRFYQLLKQHLDPGAPVAVQSTSPLMARKSFWCIDATLRASGFHTRPYHLAVPSFGVWGFVLASTEPFDIPRKTLPNLKHLTDGTLAAMFEFPRDMAPLPSEPNRLDNQVLVHLYTAEWKRWS